jgi:hypothetical protein
LVLLSDQRHERETHGTLCLALQHVFARRHPLPRRDVPDPQGAGPDPVFERQFFRVHSFIRNRTRSVSGAFGKPIQSSSMYLTATAP